MPRPPNPGTIEHASERAEMQARHMIALSSARRVLAQLRAMYATNPAMISDEAIAAAELLTEELQLNLDEGIEYVYGG